MKRMRAQRMRMRRETVYCKKSVVLQSGCNSIGRECAELGRGVDSPLGFKSSYNKACPA